LSSVSLYSKTNPNNC